MTDKELLEMPEVKARMRRLVRQLEPWCTPDNQSPCAIVVNAQVAATLAAVLLIYLSPDGSLHGNLLALPSDN